jgi:general secretion pathway protein L
MKPIRLILIPAHSADPAPWLVVGEDGRVRDRGLLDAERPLALEPMRTVAVAPGADVTVRWLELPPGSPAQVRAAAAWALRETVAAPGDRLVVAVGEAPPPGEPRLTAVVSRPLLQAWVDHLESLGAAPDVVLPDVLTVPEPEDEGALNAVTFDGSLALRGRRFAAAVQPELAELVAGGRTITPVAEPAAVEQGLIAAARRPPLNLLDGLRAGKRPAGSWRRAAALAAAVAVSPLALLLAGALRDDMAAERMRAETREAIAARFPALADSPDPAADLRRQAGVAPPPGGVSAAAAALFAAVERVEGAELDILIADPGEGVKATVSHPAYGDIEALRAAMIEAGMSVTVTGTADDAGRVVSDITIGAL